MKLKKISIKKLNQLGYDIKTTIEKANHNKS
jgi:hypothetical protein